MAEPAEPAGGQDRGAPRCLSIFVSLRSVCGVESHLNKGPVLKYRKNEARRFVDLRASEALKTLGFYAQYLS